jgi:hypothetical protein
MGHQGGTRIKNTLETKYYREGMSAGCLKHCLNCRYCKTRKAHRHKAILSIQEYPKLTRPFERTHMDLAGDFSETKRGNKYIFVIKCALTKWVIIRPILNKEMTTIIDRFAEALFAAHGAPTMLVSDRGAEFMNSLLKQICVLLNIKHVKTTPANPASNGLAENHIQTMKNMLVAYVNKYHDDWDLHIEFVAHSYYTTVHEATGFSPYYLLHGREASQPHESHYETMAIKNNEETYATELGSVLRELGKICGERVKNNVTTFNKPVKASLTFKSYKVGDYVYHYPTTVDRTI